MLSTLFKRTGLSALAAVAAASLLGLSAPLEAQQGAVSGTVVEAGTLQPVDGAQVTIQGTQLGGLTDDEGSYRITGVPTGEQTVRVRLLGYRAATRTVTVASGETVTADFQLQVSAVELSQVVVNVVTGQEETRRTLGTNEAVINAEAVSKGPISTFQDLLQGRAGGVVLQQASGTTGAGTKIRIRGANSLSLSNEPLIFVDGVRMTAGSSDPDAGFTGGQETSRLNEINPEDIANIQVIKGPAASAEYGANAANGVILITTKSGAGVSGTRWRAWAETGTLSDETDYPENVLAFTNLDPNNATGFGGPNPSYWIRFPDAVIFGAPNVTPDGMSEIFNLFSISPCPNFQAATGACTQDLLYTHNSLQDPRTSPLTGGTNQSFGGSVQSGGDVVSYYISADRSEERNVLPNNAMDKFSGQANLNARPNDNVDVNTSFKFIDANYALPNNDNNLFSPIINGLLAAPAFIPGDGGLFTAGEFRGTEASFAHYGFFLTPSENANFGFKQKVDRFTVGTNGNWTPTEWLNFYGNVGVDIATVDEPFTLQRGMGSIGGEFTLGFRNRSTGERKVWTANTSADATFQLTDGIRSSTTVGGGFDDEVLTRTSCFGANLVPGLDSCAATSQLFSVDEDFSRIRTIAGFVQQRFAFNDRLFVVGAARVDNNSAFGGDIGSQVYPSVNASWVLSEEPFFPETGSWLTEFRLRGAIGWSGLRPGFRDALTLFTPIAVTTDGSTESAVTVNSTGNPDLDPERVREFEAGFDASFAQDRFGLQFTFYNKESSDALISRQLPPSFGVAGSVFENLGTVENKGIEASLSGEVLNTEDVGFDLSLNFSANDNEILELGEGVEPIIFNRGTQAHKQGFPAGSYFQPSTSFNDANGDGLLSIDEVQITSDTAIFVDEVLPTWTSSLSANLRLFQVVSARTLLEARGGNSTNNATESFRCERGFTSGLRPTACRAVGDPNAPLDRQARFIANRFLGSEIGYLEEAEFLKIREVSVRFDAPPALGDAVPALEGSSLTLSARNLATFTDYSGLDPEINESGGSSNFTQGEFNTQPPPRILTARLDLRF